MFTTETSLGVYTVEDVVEGIGFGWFQFAITIFAGATWVSMRVVYLLTKLCHHGLIFCVLFMVYGGCSCVLHFQVVEACEVMILAILSSAVKCEWDLEDFEEAMITMVTVHCFYPLHIAVWYVHDCIHVYNKV